MDGCRACRRFRLLCDGNKPCSECLKSQRPCLDLTDADFGPLDPTSAAEAAGTAIRRGERVKLACAACRRLGDSDYPCFLDINGRTRDNKKCDNNRPCARCVARNEECVHVEKIARTIKKRCQACRVNHSKVSHLSGDGMSMLKILTA